MTISGFWSVVQDAGGAGAAQTLCAASGQLDALCAALDGTVVAIDLSVWAVQATTQPALREAGFSDDGAVRKVVFERLCNFARFGAVPVGVLDGVPPREKDERLMQRNGGKPVPHFRSAAPLARFSAQAADVMRALGFVCLQAPGEAEAFAAALNRLGAVDAVLSPDGDALTFGARVLLRNVHLSRADLRSCTLERVEAKAVCAALGVADGGTELLTAVSLLAGCDYNVDGAEQVGVKGCLRAVQQLLRDAAGASASADGGASDAGLLAALRSALDAPPDPALTALRGCTGCKRCKHDGGLNSRRAKHLASDGCVACGTACAAGGGPLGGGGCVAAPDGARCECAWHAAGEARALARVVARAAATPQFRRRFDAGLEAFRREAAAAEAAARQAVPPGGRFAWGARPDVARLGALLSRLGPGAADKPAGFSADSVLAKALPLLLLWDLAHAGAPPACFQLAAVEARSAVGASLRGGSGSNADDAAAECFRVAWRAAPWLADGDDAGARQAAAGLALAASTDAGAAKAYRTVPASTLRAHAPAALAAFAAAEARAADAEAQKAAKRQAAAAKRAAAEAKKAAEARTQPKISALLRTQRDGNASGSVSSGGAAAGAAAGAPRLPKLPDGAGFMDYVLADSDDDDSEPLPPMPAGILRTQAALAAAPEAAAAAAVSSPSPPRPGKRESPHKAGGGGGGSAKKTRPQSAAATPAQSRDLRAFFGAAPTPATTVPRAPPQQAQLPAAVAPDAAARKKLFGKLAAAGTGDDPIDLMSPSPRPPAPAAEVVDLTADSPPAAADDSWW